MELHLSKGNKQRIRKWIAALRSGKYQQGRDRLKSWEGYCCLGVACDVYRKNRKHGSWQSDVTFSDGRGGESAFNLPLSLKKYFFGTDYTARATEQTLTNMNDKEKKSFTEIADYLETLL